MCGKYHPCTCATGSVFLVPAGSSLVVSAHQHLQKQLSPPLPKGFTDFSRTLGPDELQIRGALWCKSLQVKCTEGIKVLRCSVAQHPHLMGESQNCSETLDFPLVMRGELRPLERVQSKMKEAPCTHVPGADSPVPYQWSCVRAQNCVHRDRAGQPAASVMHPLS